MLKQLHYSARLGVERLLLAAGVILLALFGAAMVHRSVLSRRALVEFDQAQAYLMRNAGAQGNDAVDFSLWSEKRIKGYKESLLIEKDAPLAVLRIARLNIRVPVFEGTGELVLNRGAGWIAGTARPGEAGNRNVGIAGHRDGFFRGVKDISIGDEVELSTLGVMSLYEVESVEIVNPDNVGVLRPRGQPALTLVTCYPFYFVGDAPRRFIVHATLKQQVAVGNSQDGGSAPARTAQFDTKEKRK